MSVLFCLLVCKSNAIIKKSSLLRIPFRMPITYINLHEKASYFFLTLIFCVHLQQMSLYNLCLIATSFNIFLITNGC